METRTCWCDPWKHYFWGVWPQQKKESFTKPLASKIFTSTPKSQLLFHIFLKMYQKWNKSICLSLGISKTCIKNLCLSLPKRFSKAFAVRWKGPALLHVKDNTWNRQHCFENSSSSGQRRFCHLMSTKVLLDDSGCGWDHMCSAPRMELT